MFNKEAAILSIPAGSNEPWTGMTAVGGFIHLIIKDKTYLIGHKSVAKEVITKLTGGKYSVIITGIAKVENRHFPNPMADFDVIKLTEFIIK